MIDFEGIINCIREADEQQEDGDYLYDVVDMEHTFSEYDYYPEFEYERNDGQVEHYEPEAYRLHLQTWTIRIGVSFSEPLSEEDVQRVAQGFTLMDIMTGRGV